jgi:hypothetical protein
MYSRPFSLVGALVTGIEQGNCRLRFKLFCAAEVIVWLKHNNVPMFGISIAKVANGTVLYHIYQ